MLYVSGPIVLYMHDKSCLKIIQRITVVKFGMYSGSCDKIGCFWNHGKGGHSEVRECENSWIYTVLRFGRRK